MIFMYVNVQRRLHTHTQIQHKIFVIKNDKDTHRDTQREWEYETERERK